MNAADLIKILHKEIDISIKKFVDNLHDDELELMRFGLSEYTGEDYIINKMNEYLNQKLEKEKK